MRTAIDDTNPELFGPAGFAREVGLFTLVDAVLHDIVPGQCPAQGGPRYVDLPDDPAEREELRRALGAFALLREQRPGAKTRRSKARVLDFP